MIDLGQALTVQERRDAAKRTAFASPRERRLRNHPAFWGDEGPDREARFVSLVNRMRAKRMAQEV